MNSFLYDSDHLSISVPIRLLLKDGPPGARPLRAPGRGAGGGASGGGGPPGGSPGPRAPDGQFHKLGAFHVNPNFNRN